MQDSPILSKYTYHVHLHGKGSVVPTFSGHRSFKRGKADLISFLDIAAYMLMVGG